MSQTIAAARGKSAAAERNGAAPLKTWFLGAHARLAI
jgi:hypothetical protein